MYTVIVGFHAPTCSQPIFSHLGGSGVVRLGIDVIIPAQREGLCSPGEKRVNHVVSSRRTRTFIH